MTDDSQLIITFPEAYIAHVQLNREQAANALNTNIALEIKDIFQKMADDPRPNTIILSGAGKHFCAGADLKERKGMDEIAWKAQHLAFREARDAVLNYPAAVIAMVNGAAFGGGLELAMVCDFIYASDNAKFALTESTLGIMPGMGGTQTLPRAIGTRRAKEYLYTGKSFTAAEALNWGVVNHVCRPDELFSDTIDGAKRIAQSAPLSVKAIKKVVDNGISENLPAAFEQELTLYNELLASEDRHEGINAFNEKRKACFSGK